MLYKAAASLVVPSVKRKKGAMHIFNSGRHILIGSEVITESHLLTDIKKIGGPTFSYVL